MPFLIPIAAAIVSAITAAVAAIAAVVAVIVAAVVTVVVAVGAVLASIAVPVVTTVAKAFTWVGYQIGSNVISIANWMAHNFDTLYKTLSTRIKAISGIISDVLETIHFKTILEIHNIAQIVSPQYRQMMRNVYKSISDASRALGFGPEFMVLALRNSRNLVLDVSTTFGHKYDLAEVQWLSSMSDALDWVSTHAETYENNPEALFNDLARLIEKPAMDAKGSFMGVFITGLETVTETAGALVDDVNLITGDLAKLVSDLPEDIRKHVAPLISPITDQWDGWIADYYTPHMNTIDGLLDQYNTSREALETNVGGIIDRLKDPSKYVSEIDDLPINERIAAEMRVHDLINRPFVPFNTAFTAAARPVHDKFEAGLRVPVPVSPPPRWAVFESTSYPIAAPGAVKPRKTWFVGDY